MSEAIRFDGPLYRAKVENGPHVGDAHVIEHGGFYWIVSKWAAPLEKTYKTPVRIMRSGLMTVSEASQEERSRYDLVVRLPYEVPAIFEQPAKLMDEPFFTISHPELIYPYDAAE